MKKRLVAIRHGKPESAANVENALIPLSDEGRLVQKEVVQRLKSEGIYPDLLLTSPLLRAEQTADLITDLFGIAWQTEPALGIKFDEELLLRKIAEIGEGQTLFFVGHAPSLADFVNRLVGKNVLPDGLSKSAAAVVEFLDEVAFGAASFVKYYQP